MEKFLVGLAVGMLGGAVLTANSCKMRTLVKKGQEEVRDRLDELMDEKLKEMDLGCETKKTEEKPETKPQTQKKKTKTQAKAQA